MSTVETAGTCTAILDELERAVVGRRRTLELVLIGILAGGHVLLEDLPGLGKTLIARSFARVLGQYVREQKALSLMDAVRKSSLMPARRLESMSPQMRQKGRLNFRIFDASLFQRLHQEIVDVRALVQRDLLALQISD